MTIDCELRAEVLRLSRGIADYVATIDADRRLLGAALLEVGLRVTVADSRRSVSAAEKRLIRSHHPDATDEDIGSHRVTPEGLGLLLSLVIAAARKYLDHQPETCAALDASPDEAAINQLVIAVTRNIENAYASSVQMGVSAYDVAAAVITNASILASRHGIPIEQMAVIHLEGIQCGLERGEPE